MNLKRINLFLILIAIFSCIIAVDFVLAENDENSGGNSEAIDEINQQIADRKKKIQEMEESIKKYEKEIDKKRTEAVSLKNQIGILDNRVAQIEADIELTETKINKTELEIDALELSIADKEQSIEKQKEIISKIIQDLNFETEKNYLEILLTNDNFAEFYNQVKDLENVYTDLGRSVRNLKNVKADLDEKKLEVDARKRSYEKLKSDLQNKKKDMEEQVEYRSGLLAQTQSSELRYKTLVENLRQKYQEIESEIRSFENQARRLIEQAEQSGEVDLGDPSKMMWPVPSKYITAEFHDKSYPYKHIFEHNAIDIRAGQATAIKAAASGYVGRAKYCSVSSCYSYVLLVHTGGLATAYGHMSKIIVSPDQYVHKGDIIGYSGGSPGTVGAGPFTTGPHLHFEVRKNGIPVNPVPYLD